MNDMAFRCEHAIAGAGGLARTDLAELNRSLRRNINSARGYCPPIELAARRLAVTRPGAKTTGCRQALDGRLAYQSAELSKGLLTALTLPAGQVRAGSIPASGGSLISGGHRIGTSLVEELGHLAPDLDPYRRR